MTSVLDNQVLSSHIWCLSYTIFQCVSDSKLLSPALNASFVICVPLRNVLPVVTSHLVLHISVKSQSANGQGVQFVLKVRLLYETLMESSIITVIVSDGLEAFDDKIVKER